MAWTDGTPQRYAPPAEAEAALHFPVDRPIRKQSLSVDPPGVPMLAPTIPDDEAARLRSLRRLGLLDTEPEERFDRVTRLAKRLFGVKVAAVTLVDADRQWFKSVAGIALHEIRREDAFCAHAILGESLFEVEDARNDPRFAGNPLVTGEPHVRFYAAYPVRAPDGSAVGSLCLLDSEPRRLEPDEELSLHDLACMVERELAATQLAVDDDKTGLANRRGFHLLAEKALALCERRGADALLVYADVVGLKAVSDLDGHEAGNRLLSRAARVMSAAYRQADVVARLGGDEFAALLADFAGDDRMAVDRLQEAVDAANAEHPGRRLAMVAAVTRWRHGDPVDLDALLREAEANMHATQVR
ncbi:MAG: GGDEF domain-containing protein [Acidimicrobiales bacterium]